MDPVMHILLPLLVLLALRVDTRKAVLFAPLALLPDLDAVLGYHRMILHSFIPVVVLPMAFIVYSKYKRPEWLMSALLVQYYLASHIVLDLAGVAFFWPFTTEMLYFQPELRFNLIGGINFEWHFRMGLTAYKPMVDTDFIAQSTFAVLLLLVLAAVVYRHEAKSAVLRVWAIVRSAVLRN